MDLSLVSNDALFAELEERFDKGWVFVGEREAGERIDADVLIFHFSHGGDSLAAGLIRAGQLHYDRKLSVLITDEEYEQLDDS